MAPYDEMAEATLWLLDNEASAYILDRIETWPVEDLRALERMFDDGGPLF